MNLFEHRITARLFYVIFSCPIMVQEEMMFAFETLQQSRRLLGLIPFITMKKPRTICGVKCLKLPDSISLTIFDDIPETGDISILSKKRSRPIHSQGVLDLVRFSLNLVSFQSPSIQSEFDFVETVNVPRCFFLY